MKKLSLVERFKRVINRETVKKLCQKRDLRPISEVLEFLLIVSIWAFNEEKYITYPIKIAYILIMGWYWLQNSRRLHWYQLWCGAMTLVSAVSLLWATDIGRGFYTFVNLLQVFLIGFVTVGYVDSKEKLNRFLHYFVWGCLILFVRLLLATPLQNWLNYSRLGTEIGYNPNDIGNKAAFSFLVALLLLRGSRKGEMKKYLVALVVAAILVLFSGSRKALLGVAVGIVFTFTVGLRDKKQLPKVLLGLLAAGVVGYLALMFIPPLYATIGRRIESMLLSLFAGASEPGSIDLRSKYMAKAWELILGSPILGIGVGNYAVVSGFGVYCHCDYLETMCSFGIPGAILYYLPILTVLARFVFKKKKSTADYGIMTILLVMAVSYITMVMYTAAYTQLFVTLAIVSYELPQNRSAARRAKLLREEGIVADSYYATLIERGLFTVKVEGAVNKVRSILLKQWLSVFNKRVTFGRGFQVRGHVRIHVNGGYLMFGDNIFINSGSSINCRERITIGSNVLFGENVHIYDHNHAFSRRDVPIAAQGFRCKPVTIGNGCWIGSNVTILAGVTIGDGCVIGANCLITEDVPAGVVVRNIQRLSMEPRRHTESAAKKENE